MPTEVPVQLVAGGHVRVDLDTAKKQRLDPRVLIHCGPLLNALAGRLGWRPGNWTLYRLGHFWFVELRPAGILPGVESWHELTPGELAAWRAADAIARSPRPAAEGDWITGTRADLNVIWDRTKTNSKFLEELERRGEIELERIAVPGRLRPLFRIRVRDPEVHQAKQRRLADLIRLRRS